MSKRLYAKVTSNQPVGADIFLLSLTAPAIAQAARPGQFVMLRVSPGPEPLLARPFSVFWAEENEVQILYRVVGRGTRLLKEVVEGQKLSMWGPLGTSFDLNIERPLLVAGGMGIAPIFFASKFLVKHSIDRMVIYGVSSKQAFMVWDESAGNHKYLLEGLDWEPISEDGSIGRMGLVTELLNDHLSLPASSRPKPGAVLACGPLPMLRAVAKLCAEFDVACQTSLEAPMACGVGACLGCAIPAAGGGYLRACQEGPVMEASLVDWERIKA